MKLAAYLGLVTNIIAVILFISIISGCIDVDEAIDKASNTCEMIFDEKIEEVKTEITDEVWDICTNFYEDVVIPQLETSLSEATDELIVKLREEFDQALIDAENEIMTRLGCIKVDTLAGWDCSEADVCSL